MASNWIVLGLVGVATCHMALVTPAPRRSASHPNYNYTNIDYNLLSPLGGEFTFPCRGAPKGPTYKAYAAGSDINVLIGGAANHEGGHCQFSMTYDHVNFAVLKTVMGDCISSTFDYKVPIPRNAPNGEATFVWTWFNRRGNREMYMNCVDIEINGGSENGTIEGRKMVIANMPGYPIFPEGFGQDYAQELYDEQPTITISP
ncbi:hypothetical protein DSO57_1035526 [Entomophthora muscae]|uniref:Uncharacterized protein n=1 Tax=Entomophthora muscae TaxID=34485 RepID=A0ACC2UKF7_9FUNG|nr:hypothetical protein DSO57_1035526 [Entomophthora muscae]